MKLIELRNEMFLDDGGMFEFEKIWNNKLHAE